MKNHQLYIGLHASWDAMSYPRVNQWPLPDNEEKAIIAEYTKLPVIAYTSVEDWRKYHRSLGLYGYHTDVTFTGDSIPKEVFLIMEFTPEKCTWRAWDPSEVYPYRLAIGLAWCPDVGRRAFATLEEVESVRLEHVQRKPNHRFGIVHIPVQP